MVEASVDIPNRPRSLPRFLALWVASYLAPVLLTLAAVVGVLVAGAARNDDPGRYAAMIVSLCLLPAGFAFGQWVLMRRYLRKRALWSAATLAGAVLGQLANLFVPEATGETLGSFPQLNWVFTIVGRILGWEIAADTMTTLPVALCFGAAWSIPQGLALPGPRAAKMMWMSVMMLTAFAVVVMIKTLSRELLEAQVLNFSPARFWIFSVARFLLPTILGWLILSLVSGSMMYWNLRRGSAAGITRVYERFD
jgi:hypothetical protein